MVVVDHQPTSLSGPFDALARATLVDCGFPDRTEVSIHVVDVETITLRNLEAFGKNEPTDVVSFPVEHLTPGDVPVPAEGAPPLILGDVFIAPSIVEQRAVERGDDIESAQALMVVHGVLHLMGYDHADDSDAELMEAIEARVLATHGYTRP